MENSQPSGNGDTGSPNPRRGNDSGRTRLPLGTFPDRMGAWFSGRGHLVAGVIIVAMILLWCLICGNIFSDWVLAVLDPKCQTADSLALDLNGSPKPLPIR